MARKAECVAVFLLSAGACLGQERNLGDAQNLQAEVAAWARTSQESSFRGVVEFEKVIRRPADPARLEQVAALGDEVPAGGVLNPEAVGRTDQLLLEWGANGIEVVQAWRVAVADEDRLRVEVSIRHRRPVDPVAEPMVTVVAFDGARPWQWSSVGRTIAQSAVDPCLVDGELLAQGRDEVRRLINYNPLRKAQLRNVRGSGDIILAEIESLPDKAGSRWTSQLTFLRDGRRLLLTEQVTIRPDRERYCTATFSDYRDSGGRPIPYQRTIRSGPLAELSAEERPSSDVRVYRIRKIKEAESGTEVASFALPAGVNEDPWRTRQYSYEDISGQGAVPYRPQ